MTVKHTPGPWRASTASMDGFRPIMAPGGAIVSLVSNLAGNPSDARLIAAAPDLLEALTLLVAGIENSVSDTYIPLVKARAAIAKATGEQA